MEPLHIAYLLITIGLLLLVAELFIPSGGIIFAFALCALVAGVWMTFQHSSDPYVGWLTLTGILISVSLLSAFMIHFWPKTRMGRLMFLAGPDEDATVASMPVNVELEQLRGRFGRALSALRPAGVVDFDGRRIDVVSEGMMIDPGTWVRCIDVRAGKVVVRAIEKPDIGKLENADFG